MTDETVRAEAPPEGVSPVGDIAEPFDVGSVEVGDRGEPDVEAHEPGDVEEAEPPSPLEVAVAERDGYLDSLRRLQADFENYRRRVQRDTELAVDRATEALIGKMLPVLDTFELALAHTDDPDNSSLAKLHDTLLTALESEGLLRLFPEGLPFDPAEAEAVAYEPDDGDGGGQVVVDVMRAGYRWKGRVMRAAMVKVKG